MADIVRREEILARAPGTAGRGSSLPDVAEDIDDPHIDFGRAVDIHGQRSRWRQRGKSQLDLSGARIGRLDEAAAARKPVLRWKPKQAAGAV